MKKITSEIVRAFRNGEVKKIGNSYTDGNALFLFDNKIAEFRKGYLWITNAGWRSATTKERLNALPGVNIQQSNFVWYLDGKEWDGGWTKTDFVRDEKKEDNPFRAMAMVMKLGEVLTDNKKEANAWKLRMAKAGMGQGIDLPDNWDTLPEEEKERRLNGIIDMNLKNE